MTILIEPDMSLIPTFAFGQTSGTVQTNLGTAFTGVAGIGSAQDFSAVDFDGTRCIRVRYLADQQAVKTFFVGLTPTPETYRTYDVWFETGFDFGDSAGEDGGAVTPGQRIDATALKLPGLGNDSAANSGGGQTAAGFSIRTYVVGASTNPAATFNTSRDREVWATYPYYNTLNAASWPGAQAVIAPGDAVTDPVFHPTAGTPGIGDPDNVDVATGQWVRVVLGVIHDTTNPYTNSVQKLWIDGVQVMEQDGYEFTSDPTNAAQQTDEIVFSTFHGGFANEDWLPDVDSFAVFRNFRASTTEAEALAPFATDNTTPALKCRLL